MDTGTRWLVIILLLVGLIVLDVAWYGGYHLDQIARTLDKMLPAR